MAFRCGRERLARQMAGAQFADEPGVAFADDAEEVGTAAAGGGASEPPSSVAERASGELGSAI